MRYTVLATMAATALMSLPAAAATTTTTASFDGNKFDLVGTASMVGTDLQLTSSAKDKSGAAWLDTALSTSKSFSTTYSFSLANIGGNYIADGISLAFQSKGTSALGTTGSNVGYTNLNAVGSVIQTWIGFGTAGLNIDGKAANIKAAPAPLKSAKLVTGTETVAYNAVTNQLSMTGVLNVGGKSYQISDSASVNLSTKFGQTMYLGFTGGTGSVAADQRITSFTVSAVPEPATYAMLLAGLGLFGIIARRRKLTQA